MTGVSYFYDVAIPDCHHEGCSDNMKNQPSNPDIPSSSRGERIYFFQKLVGICYLSRMIDFHVITKVGRPLYSSLL